MSTTVRVLIVDDDRVDYELTRRILLGSGRMSFQPEWASSLADALKAIETHKFDVILLDLNLPDSQGLVTVDALQQCCEHLPIIVLSGLSDEQTALRSIDQGTQDYLVKGNVTTESLANAIRYAIQRQQLLHEISSAKEMLERKNHRLAELCDTAHRFVDNVSHEFRTPLTVIKEYTSLVRDGMAGAVTDDQCRFLDIVGDRADDLNTMVDDMLDISKHEAGLLSTWRKNCQVSDIVDDVRRSLERKAEIRGVRLEFDLDDSLPQIFCDPEKIGRVLINLTINAIKVCSRQGHVRIWAKTIPNTSLVRIGVTDNGPGISPEGIASLFQRFKQLNTNSRESCKGFGLGLNIAKELVDINFGEMQVESEVGRGSTFSFTLVSARPVDITQRYLTRLAQLQVGTPIVSVVSAEIADAVDLTTADDVDAYLHAILRRHDLLFRTSAHRWALLLAVNAAEFEGFKGAAMKTLHDLSRNRLQGPLPTVSFFVHGQYRPVHDMNQVCDQVEDLFTQAEVLYV